MMTKKMQAEFNKQIQHETYSSYLYLAMAAYFHDANLDGFARWMRVQAKEETTHAMKFFDHLRERGVRIELAAIEKPQLAWKSPLDAFKAAYAHEQFISGRIGTLCALAEKEKDFASRSFLNWFVDEQVEEEANASEIVAMLERIKDSGSALVMLDRQLGKREFKAE